MPMEFVQEMHSGLFVGAVLGAWAIGLGVGLQWVAIVKVLDLAR